MPRCFSCGILGHTSRDSPIRNGKQKKEVEQKQQLQSKKRDKAPKNQAEGSIANVDATNMTTAALFGQPFSILQDIGFQMTIVPEELVPQVAHTGSKVQLHTFEGSTKEVGTPNVLLTFDENDWQGEVAMVKGEELNGKGLLAVSVKDSMSWGILCAYAE